MEAVAVSNKLLDKYSGRIGRGNKCQPNLYFHERHMDTEIGKSE
jgi:hypothetical protein